MKSREIRSKKIVIYLYKKSGGSIHCIKPSKAFDRKSFPFKTKKQGIKLISRLMDKFLK